MPASQTPPVHTDHIPDSHRQTDLIVVCVEGGTVRWCASEARHLRIVLVDADGPSPVGWEQRILSISDADPQIVAIAASIRDACRPAIAAAPVTCRACRCDVWQGFDVRASCFSHRGEARPRAFVRWFSCALCCRPADAASMEALVAMAGNSMDQEAQHAH